MDGRGCVTVHLLNLQSRRNDRSMDIKPRRAYGVPSREGLKSTYSWNPDMPKDHILRVSKSSLGAFQFCEQQYFIKYILGVREPETDDMIRGTNIHDAVEDFYNNVNVGYATSMRSYGRERVLDFFCDHIPKESRRNGPYERGEEQHLRHFFEKEANRFMVCDPELYLPYGNEISLNAVVKLDVNGTEVMVHLTGIIDRLFVDEEGNIHIHELKTGYWKDKPQKFESMRKEMAFYVYLINKCYDSDLSGSNSSFWGWDHTKGLIDAKKNIIFDDAAFRHVEPVRSEEVASMLADLKGLISAHMRYTGNKNGKMFAQKSDFLAQYICEPWCRVKGFCPKYHHVLMPHDMKIEAGIVDEGLSGES